MHRQGRRHQLQRLLSSYLGVNIQTVFNAASFSVSQIFLAWYCQIVSSYSAWDVLGYHSHHVANGDLPRSQRQTPASWRSVSLRLLLMEGNFQASPCVLALCPSFHAHVLSQVYICNVVFF